MLFCAIHTNTSYLTQNTANAEYSRSSTFMPLNLGRMPTRLLKL